jgi:hypothetical protein
MTASPQSLIEDHCRPPLGLPVVQGPFLNGAVEHFFQAQGLSAELDPICIVFFRASTLVLYRQG